MTDRLTILGTRVLACIAFSAVLATAGPIAVINPSFEDLGGAPLIPCAAQTAGCGFTVAAIPGWSVTSFPGGLTGQFLPDPGNNATYFDSVPDGVTVAYTTGGTISQDVADTVQVGLTYVLRVDRGTRKDFPALGVIELLIGGTPILATGTPATPGNWSTYTATYTGLAGDAGSSIGIRLSASGLEGDFDNVRLATVPEPASLILLGSGFALIWLARRRRA